MAEAVQQPESWGPYLDYQIITTPHGDFGLARAHVLTFGTRPVFNKETQRIEEAPYPIYTPVEVEDSRTVPTSPEEQKIAAASRKRALQRAEEILS